MSVPEPDPRPLRPPSTPPRLPSRGDAAGHEPVAAFEFWNRDRSWGRPPGLSLLDRLRGDPRVGVVALLVTALVAGLLWYRIGVDASGEPVGASTSRSSASASSAPPTADGDGAKASASGSEEDASSPDTAGGPSRSHAGDDADVIVHVAGAVVRPGIVHLRSGARVVDAIEAAGGARPDADLDALNLAAKVADGQRIGVGTPGQPATAVGPGGASASGGADAGASGGLLDLNTATQAEIEALPGIGPVLGAAILRERDERGGFRSVDELRSVRGIGEKRFEDLRDLVTV